MARLGPDFVVRQDGADVQPVFLPGHGRRTPDRNADDPAAQRSHVQVQDAGFDGLTVRGQGPAGLVMGSIEEMVAVPHLHDPLLRIHRQESQRRNGWALFFICHISGCGVRSGQMLP